jgi:hypothetical protein
VEKSNRCTKCNDKSLTLEFHQSYKTYLRNKSGRTKKEYTKFLPDLDLEDSLRKGDFEWQDSRSRSSLFFFLRYHGGIEEIASSRKVNNGARTRLERLVAIG